jgi:hypothetical protein
VVPIFKAKCSQRLSCCVMGREVPTRRPWLRTESQCEISTREAAWVQAVGNVAETAAISHASERRWRGGGHSCCPPRFFLARSANPVYTAGMSLITLKPSALLRRQQALFVVPAEAVRSAAGQGNWAAACAALRVNALSCIKSAEHGWIGASFSCCEILAVLHLHHACSGMAPDNIILSKGHAAAMQ